MRRLFLSLLLCAACSGDCNAPAPKSAPFHFKPHIYAFGGGGGALSFDLTTGVLPSGLTVTRTGSGGAGGLGTVYLQTSSTTVSSTTAAALYEDRGEGLGKGLWIFDTYTNTVTAPFDFRAASGWTIASPGSGSVTVDQVNGPDGTLTADQILDTSAAVAYSLTWAGATSNETNNNASVWSQVSPTVPTSPPAMSSQTGGLTFATVLGTASTWARSTANTWKSSNQIDKISLYPSIGAPLGTLTYSGLGSYPPTITSTVAPTGGVYLWGAQSVEADADVPLVDGTTTAVTVQPSGSLSGMLQPGANDYHVQLSFLMDRSNISQPIDSRTLCPFSMTTADGSTNFCITQSTFDAVTLSTKINGVANVETLSLNFLDYTNGAVEALVEPFSISGKGAGFNFWLNGCRATFGATSHGTYQTMHVPTAAWVGSDQAAASTFKSARYTSVDFANTADINRAEFVLLSHSEFSNTNTQTRGVNLACAWIYTLEQSRTHSGIVNYAHVGDTIVNQTTKWQASAQRGVDTVSAVIIELGTNDANNGDSEVTMVAHLQTLINDINTNNPSAKIILLPNTPCHAFLGDTKWNVLYAFHLDMQGIGTQTITGSNLIRAPATLFDPLSDGNGNLVARYNSGDNVHPTAEGMRIEGALTRGYMQQNSFLNN